ncbi:MAG: CapA family protein [Gemmatimonadota bacterium]|nr:CapA family protein [Gemmatimonadota bacterium]
MSSKRSRGLLNSATALASFAIIGLAPQLAAQSFEDARGNMSFSLAGDAIITRAMQPYREPGFLALRDLIQGTTAGFVNLEVLFHDYEEDVIPAASSGGTYMRAEPRLASELTWFGFDMVSLSNNHTMDFGAGGARRTKKAAEAAGLSVAGFGENLAAARAPAFTETPGGRVALISIASTFSDGMRAGHQRPDMRGRPGLSPMRYQTEVTVLPADMAGLRGAINAWRPGAGNGRSVGMSGVRFVEGSSPGVRTTAHAGDLAEVVAVVEDARRQADWVIVTSHSHEGAPGNRNVPADFVVEVAHAVIDAGAHMFVAHGPHVVRGIEIYKDAPIFYSLANFIFQNETVELQPADNYAAQGLEHTDHPGQFQSTRIENMGGGFPADPAYWESFLAVTEYEAGKLKEVRLHPITLGHGLSRAVRGRPILADEELGWKILDEMAELSRPFGATLTVENGVGIIRP